MMTRRQFLARSALLGSPIGPEEALFDPGRRGSYFQTPMQVKKSAETLKGCAQIEILDYRHLLQYCSDENLGLYVSF